MRTLDTNPENLPLADVDRRAPGSSNPVIVNLK